MKRIVSPLFLLFLLFLLFALFLLASVPALARSAAEDRVARARIRAEAADHSRVMAYAFELSEITERYGARMTGTPAFRDAGTWAPGE